MIANNGQLTPPCVRKCMVVIPGYIEWPNKYHGKIRLMRQTQRE